MIAALISTDPAVARPVNPAGGATSLGLTLNGFVAQADPINAAHPINPVHPSLRNQLSGSARPSRQVQGFTGVMAWPIPPSKRADCRVFDSLTSVAVLFQGTDMDAKPPRNLVSIDGVKRSRALRV